jgi:hypothetical protein
MNFIKRIEKLLSEKQNRKAKRLFGLYFSISTAEAQQHIDHFTANKTWDSLPSPPQTTQEIHNHVRTLWVDRYKLQAIEFYQLHMHTSLRESKIRVEECCADLSSEDDE